MITGLGIEIVEVKRFNRVMDRWGPPLLKRLFTEGELKYCLGKRSPGLHLAARFAAKISFFKAMGGFMPFQDLDVVRDASGRPSIRVFSGRACRFRSSLTITHTGGTAMAVVILESE